MVSQRVIMPVNFLVWPSPFIRLLLFQNPVFSVHCPVYQSDLRVVWCHPLDVEWAVTHCWTFSRDDHPNNLRRKGLLLKMQKILKFYLWSSQNKTINTSASERGYLKNRQYCIIISEYYYLYGPIDSNVGNLLKQHKNVVVWTWFCFNFCK